MWFKNLPFDGLKVEDLVLVWMRVYLIQEELKYLGVAVMRCIVEDGPVVAGFGYLLDQTVLLKFNNDLHLIEVALGA